MVRNGGPLADRARAHDVVVEERELAAEPFLQLGQLRVALIPQKIHLQPDDVPAFAVQIEPRIVHAVLIEVGEDLGPDARSAPRWPRTAWHRGSLRFLSSNVCILRRRKSAEADGPLPVNPAAAMASLAATFTLLDVRMHGRRGVGRIEERLAQAQAICR
jgi:hypothetical protein